MNWVSDYCKGPLSVSSNLCRREKPHALSAGAALDATRIALAASAAARGGSGKPSKGNDLEENSKGANEHIG